MAQRPGKYILQIQSHSSPWCLAIAILGESEVQSNQGPATMPRCCKIRSSTKLPSSVCDIFLPREPSHLCAMGFGSLLHSGLSWSKRRLGIPAKVEASTLPTRKLLELLQNCSKSPHVIQKKNHPKSAKDSSHRFS